MSGEEVELSKMTDEHLNNCLNYIISGKSIGKANLDKASPLAWELIFDLELWRREEEGVENV